MNKSIIGLLLIICRTTLVFGQQTEERPNILWIVSEDNSPFIGAYGDRQATTPNIDRLASEGVLFQNAYCTAAVCAPSRSTLITGMYPPSIGTENMSSEYPAPGFVKLFPRYLREAGYYTTNNAKKHYNTVDQPEAWDESSKTATYQNRKPGQPFFAVFNIEISHESSLFDAETRIEMIRQFGVDPTKEMLEATDPPLRHHPDSIPIPPYLPATPEMKHDWALYYDKVEDMDARVGQLLQELEDAGLSDNTIVFYYADNGGVLGRSKRFMFESGLRIPLIVRVPEKYKHLNPYGTGSSTDRLVDFTDFAPTLLKLAGTAIPDYYQGRPFLGEGIDPTGKDKEIVLGFRGRMDERFDLVRTIRKGKYRYTRNFMPHKPYGQHIQFLWLAKSMQSWEKAFKEGSLNEVQAKFFLPKPTEELYDVEADPHNIHNLATDPHYKRVLDSLRSSTHELLVELNDVGFIPEGAVEEISKEKPIYDYVRSHQYDIRKVLDLAYAASSRDRRYTAKFLENLESKDPILRYWAALGLLILDEWPPQVQKQLLNRLQDEAPYVRIAAAEALLGKDQSRGGALKAIGEQLQSPYTMIRLQALNALVAANGDELEPFEQDLEQIVENKVSEYDVKAAYYLLNAKLGHEEGFTFRVNW